MYRLMAEMAKSKRLLKNPIILVKVFWWCCDPTYMKTMYADLLRTQKDTLFKKVARDYYLIPRFMRMSNIKFFWGLGVQNYFDVPITPVSKNIYINAKLGEKYVEKKYYVKAPRWLNDPCHLFVRWWKYLNKGKHNLKNYYKNRKYVGLRRKFLKGYYRRYNILYTYHKFAKRYTNNVNLIYLI